GKLQIVAELLLVSPQDLGRKCRISPLEAKSILDSVCQNNAPQIRSLSSVSEQESCCTTGDSYLDVALGGGLRTGMVWEIFGEGGAGKTQMALQLLLLVQIPVNLGGLSGSACYITINTTLQTARLLQMVDSHPLLSQETCSLDDIQTISSPTLPILVTVLSTILPGLIASRDKDPRLKPVKLLVIDALADLFHASEKTTTATLIERSQNIAEISTLLHALANTHNIAVLVVNNATDVFHPGDQDATGSGADLHYKQQSRWFGGAEMIPGEGNKEASLGLVWANQVNARIMMSRTGRRRYLDDNMDNKRQKVADADQSKHSAFHPDDGGTLVRRLSIVFSSVAPPCSLDYILTAAGISILPDDGGLLLPKSNSTSLQIPAEVIPACIFPVASQLAPLDVGSAEHIVQSETAPDEDEEWYWNIDDISDEMYSSLGADAFDPSE
ncbi:P-loop containing nucleoside triphosphate hydrolase protein, partial [Mycena pura]